MGLSERMGRLGRHGRRSFRFPLPALPAGSVRRAQGSGPRGARPAQRRSGRPGLARLPLQRAERDGQDVLGADFGQGAQLRGARRRRALWHLHVVRRDHPGQLPQCPRARCGVQQRRRCHARSRGPCRTGHAGTLEGVHRRRGPHAVDGGGQRPVEDVGRATEPRRLRPGDHGPAEGATDHPEPDPASRVPAPGRGDIAQPARVGQRGGGAPGRRGGARSCRAARPRVGSGRALCAGSGRRVRVRRRGPPRAGRRPRRPGRW